MNSKNTKIRINKIDELFENRDEARSYNDCRHEFKWNYCKPRSGTIDLSLSEGEYLDERLEIDSMSTWKSRYS